MNILIADKFPDDRRRQLEQAGCTVTYEPGWTHDDLPKQIGSHAALIVRSTKVQADTISAADALKLIIRAGSGTNTIDKEAAAAKDIAVCNTPGKNAVAVAELVIGLILSLDRRIPENVSDLRQGIWNKALYSKAAGLKGKTLGLIGLGAIARHVARRALAFEMKVVAVGSGRPPSMGPEPGVELVERASLLSQADIISLHAPAKAETKNMIDAAFLDAMRPHAMLINCARAELVDHDALAVAVKERGLLYACDVPPNEPKDKSGSYTHPLFELPGVYGTHHIGASTEQAQDAVAETVVEIIEAYRKDGSTLHRVN